MTNINNGGLGVSINMHMVSEQDMRRHPQGFNPGSSMGVRYPNVPIDPNSTPAFEARPVTGSKTPNPGEAEYDPTMHKGENRKGRVGEVANPAKSSPGARGSGGAGNSAMKKASSSRMVATNPDVKGTQGGVNSNGKAGQKIRKSRLVYHRDGGQIEELDNGEEIPPAYDSLSLAQRV